MLSTVRNIIRTHLFWNILVEVGQLKKDFQLKSIFQRGRQEDDVVSTELTLETLALRNLLELLSWTIHSPT
jgi:hypothetical protein